MQSELSLPVNQALALFAKVIRKITKRLQDIQKEAIGASIPVETATVERNLAGGDISGATSSWKPVEVSVDAELKEAGDEVTKRMREMQREMIDSLDLSK